MKLTTAKDNANTTDIIYYLAAAAPAAIEQVKKMNLAEIIGLNGANVKKDAELTGKWIRSNIQYLQDGYENQNIQFPSAILKSKKADCKSLSLLYLAIMLSRGYSGGFRFAAYKSNKQFTHVYNYFLDSTGKKLIFDACVPGLKESPRHTNLKDMKVNYIAGAPIMMDDTGISRPVKKVVYRGVIGYQYQDTGEFISEPEFIGRKRFRDRVNEAWKNVKKKAGKAAGNAWKGFTKVNLAGPRISFLSIVRVNARGFAGKLNRLLEKNPDKLKELWERLGGDYTRLMDAIKKGAKLKPLFGQKGGKKGKRISGYNGIYDGIEEPEFIGMDPATLTAALAAATPIIVAVTKILNKEGIKNEPGEEPPADDPGLPEPGPDDKEAVDAVNSGKFEPTDPEGEEATAYVKSKGQVFVNTKGEVVEQPKGMGSDLLSSKNLLIFGGIATLGAILLLRKKK